MDRPASLSLLIVLVQTLVSDGQLHTASEYQQLLQLLKGELPDAALREGAAITFFKGA